MFVFTIALIFIIFLLVLYLNLTSVKSYENIKTEMIKTAIIKDAANRYKDADIINIYEISKQQDKYLVKVRVTFNYSSPCPKRLELIYDYPSQHFTPKKPTWIVNDCNLCKFKSCKIIFEEEAIIASLNVNGTEDVRDFVLKTNAIPSVKHLNDIWIVKWSDTNQTYVVTLNQDGLLKGIKKI